MSARGFPGGGGSCRRRRAGRPQARRAGALLLVAAGWAACGPRLPSEVPLGGEEESPDAATSASASAAPAPPPPPEPEPPPPPPPEPTTSAAPSASAPTPPAASSAAPVAVAPGCRMDQGTVPACELRPSGEQCFMLEPVKMACTRLGEVLQPAPAEATVRCFLQKSATPAVCEFEVIPRCAREGLRAACVDARAEALCADAFQRCPPEPSMAQYVDRDLCVRGVSALRPQHRERLEACLKKRCELTACVMEALDPGPGPSGGPPPPPPTPPPPR